LFRHPQETGVIGSHRIPLPPRSLPLPAAAAGASMMYHLMQHIERYLMSCRELAAFCEQNGWIDTRTLGYEIIEQNDHHVIALVQFEKVVARSSGHIVDRVPCQGRLRLTLDRYGSVSHAELL
jgi:hypothetical protein